MIVDKKQPQVVVPEVETTQDEIAQGTTPKVVTVEEAVGINALVEAYHAVRKILSEIRVDDNGPNSPLLFKTIKFDNGQLARIKNSKHNDEYALAFPAVLIHYINVYYNIGQSRVCEGKGTMRIHYILNRLNNSDDVVEMDGLEVFNKINSAIQARKADFPALVNRFQLAYWDQPLSFDDGLQPYWIDYQIWFSEYSGYRYKDYVETHIVIPPFTNHSDQLPESNENEHKNHDTPIYDEVSGFSEPE